MVGKGTDTRVLGRDGGGRAFELNFLQGPTREGGVCEGLNDSRGGHGVNFASWGKIVGCWSLVSRFIFQRRRGGFTPVPGQEVDSRGTRGEFGPWGEGC